MVAMWRLHVLAYFIYWYDLLGIGLAMINGSYYDERVENIDFPEPFDGDNGVE